MPEWRTYELADFLMFAPDVYWRLVARYNAEAWPLQLLALAAGAGLLWLATKRPQSTRVLAGVLALAWAHVGWSFHWQHFAQINWPARYFAAACAAQAMLLLVSAVWPRKAHVFPMALWRRSGLAIAAAGLGYPLLAPIVGRTWAQAEVFALMPEPTALMTLGLLLATGGTRRGLLATIPVLSLVVGWTMLWLFIQQ